MTEARAKEDSASAHGHSGSAFSDEFLLNDVEQLKHLLPYHLSLAEKALKNMRIRTKESEDRRRERWGQKHQGYQDKRKE